MGSLVIPAENPNEVLPTVSFNASGQTAWSGKHVADLTGLDVIAILVFCRNEGYRRGWNDAIYNRDSSGEASSDGPFPCALLGGFPSDEWQYSYQRGVEECKDARGE